MVQATLIAVSVTIPLALWARRTLGGPAGAVIGACYGLSWGIASGVGYDFHEVAFAIPLLAFSLTALGNDRLMAAACWALPLLFSEGGPRTHGCPRRARPWPGGATAVSDCSRPQPASVGSVLALFVVLPGFNPSGSFTYWFLVEDGSGAADGTGGSADDAAGSAPPASQSVWSPPRRVSTLLLVLAPPCSWPRGPRCCGAHADWCGASPSSNSLPLGEFAHYSLVLMPTVFAAFIDALVRRGTNGRSLRRSSRALPP